MDAQAFHHWLAQLGQPTPPPKENAAQDSTCARTAGQPKRHPSCATPIPTLPCGDKPIGSLGLESQAAALPLPGVSAYL